MYIEYDLLCLELSLDRVLNLCDNREKEKIKNSYKSLSPILNNHFSGIKVIVHTKTTKLIANAISLSLLDEVPPPRHILHLFLEQDRTSI